MTALTLHAIDDTLAKRLQRSARLEGKSMNLFAKELLASALGLTAPRRPRVRNDLARFCGTLSDEDAAAIKQTLKDFDRIDEELWK